MKFKDLLKGGEVGVTFSFRKGEGFSFGANFKPGGSMSSQELLYDISQLAVKANTPAVFNNEKKHTKVIQKILKKQKKLQKVLLEEKAERANSEGVERMEKSFSSN